MTELIFSEKDSARFGLRIARMHTDTLDVPSILQQIVDQNLDTAIIRIPTINIAQIDPLARTSIPFLITDTLAYYQYDIENSPEKELSNPNLEFYLAGPDDHREINRIVSETFGNYVNHYRNNPMFDNWHVNDGYKDWVQSYAQGDPNRVCWLIKDKGEIVGFATFNFEKAETEELAEGILYGVAESARDKGIFRDIFRYAIKECKKRGNITTLQTVAQIENIGAQKVWTSEGFYLVKSENTIHVNALLTKTIFEPFAVDHVIKSEETNTMKVSNRHILRQINWHLDFKRNIVTQNHKFVNLIPVEIDKNYTLKFSFPSGNRGLLQVCDENGKIYLLVYFLLKHFVS